MNGYSIKYPTNIIFGTDSYKRLSDYLPKNQRTMIVSGKSAITNGVAELIFSALKNYEVVNACGMAIPEPDLNCVDALIQKGRKEKISTVIGVGGGSAIDAAKAAAALIPEQGEISDYFSGRRNIENKGLFFAALPTTAGTGAEITNNSVLTDPILKIKKSLRHPSMIADLAIIDPKLTISVPPATTAFSGLDALTQAIESFVSKNANNLTKSLALKAVELLFFNLKEVVANGKNSQARERMAEGSMLSALAFSQSGLGAVHAFAHPIGSLKHIAHGKICAILLPHIIKFNSDACSEEFKQLSQICGLRSIDEFINAIKKMNDLFNIPEDLSSFELSEKDISFVIKNSKSKSFDCNPKSITDNEVKNLILNLMGKN